MGEVEPPIAQHVPCSVWTIIVAAGSGTRFGGPKQLVAVANKRVLDWSLASAQGVSDGVVVVVSEADRDIISATLSQEQLAAGSLQVVAGGATRSESVRAGMSAVPAETAVIVVHDGARPAANEELFRRVVAPIAAGTAEAVIPVVPLVDSIRWRDGGVVDRDRLVAVQTPQAFAANALRRAHTSTPDATDDASVVEAVGGRVLQVPGLVENQKLTVPADLPTLEAVLTQRIGDS